LKKKTQAKRKKFTGENESRSHSHETEEWGCTIEANNQQVRRKRRVKTSKKGSTRSPHEKNAKPRGKASPYRQWGIRIRQIATFSFLFVFFLFFLSVKRGDKIANPHLGRNSSLFSALNPYLFTLSLLVSFHSNFLLIFLSSCLCPYASLSFSFHASQIINFFALESKPLAYPEHRILSYD
jgi:hypothetical protein